MSGFQATLGVVDRPHFPPPGAPRRADFKEWYHFNVLDEAQQIDLIVNVSFAGDVTRAGGARVDVIALAHHQGWWGGIDSYDIGASTVDPHRLALHVAQAAGLSYHDGHYHVHAQVPGLSVQARLQATCEPMLLWNDTPLGTGHLNWLIAPHLVAQGCVTLAQGPQGAQTLAFEQACAYHDHNWGHWRWGDDFGWEWGFATHTQEASQTQRLCMVFDRTTDKLGVTSHEQTLAIWRGAGLAKVFTRQCMRTRRSGRFDGPIPRRPGVANLVAPGLVLTVPAQLQISAREDDDWIDLHYVVDAAMQIAVPNEHGFGLVGLNETFGFLEARGRIAGQDVGFRTRACFEFLG